MFTWYADSERRELGLIESDDYLNVMKTVEEMLMYAYLAEDGEAYYELVMDGPERVKDYKSSIYEVHHTLLETVMWLVTKKSAISASFIKEFIKDDDYWGLVKYVLYHMTPRGFDALLNDATDTTPLEWRQAIRAEMNEKGQCIEYELRCALAVVGDFGVWNRGSYVAEEEKPYDENNWQMWDEWGCEVAEVRKREYQDRWL